MGDSAARSVESERPLSWVRTKTYCEIWKILADAAVVLGLEEADYYSGILTLWCW